ncbi:MAG: DNA polymerase III subunit gamma/tau [Cyanobacteria bacterium SIG29]|nr:DNA polymerase III subunit gamma/tau [Cyanobacteria bacterium SIG29]
MIDISKYYWSRQLDNKYVPLYRKYRPQTFHDLIGQENIVHALSKAIELDRIAHAYLLCGPRGTGKTSSARILAKSLNCKEGPTLTPCGKCPACLDILNSVPVDVVEIDAASNRSVEDTQAILEKIQYVPVNGKYKIYIIDEVHMLSTTAFNALLKTLEEPPENVIFILATTEPHKVLDTIISRCQRFDYRRITTEDIVKRLEFISEKENINISKEALYTIAKNSQGGMRDSLSLLDQISVLGASKQIDVNDVNEILGRISYETLSKITDYIIQSDSSNAVPLIDSIYAKGNEPVQIVSNLTQYFRDMMIVKNCSDKELVYSLTQVNEVNYENIKAQADKFSVSEIIQIIDKLAYYSIQIKDASNRFLWLELCIVDLTNYKNLPSVENLLKRIEKLEAQLASGNIKVTSTPQVSVAPQMVVKNDVEKVQTNVPKPEVKPQVVQAPQSKPASLAPSAGNSDLHNLWVSILQSIDSPPNKAFYTSLARPVEITDKKVVVAFTKEMFIKQAKEGSKKQALFDAVCRYLNVSNIEIEIVTSDSIDLSKKVVAPPPVKKQEIETDIRKQDEEEYQNFVEAKKEEQNQQVKVVDSSSQAAMVKELFDGKYID